MSVDPRVDPHDVMTRGCVRERLSSGREGPRLLPERSDEPPDEEASSVEHVGRRHVLGQDEPHRVVSLGPPSLAPELEGHHRGAAFHGAFGVLGEPVVGFSVRHDGGR